MLAFVTVGSTSFDTLIHAILATHVLSSLHKRNYTELVIQCGNTQLDWDVPLEQGQCHYFEKNGIKIEVWRFKPSLQDDFQRADLIISHAGSGTVLDVLRIGKPLIVVPNPTLLDNHQQELADALDNRGYLRCATVSNLSRVIEDFQTSKTRRFPSFDGSRFQKLLDEEMGFS